LLGSDQEGLRIGIRIADLKHIADLNQIADLKLSVLAPVKLGTLCILKTQQRKSAITTITTTIVCNKNKDATGD